MLRANNGSVITASATVVRCTPALGGHSCAKSTMLTLSGTTLLLQTDLDKQPVPLTAPATGHRPRVLQNVAPLRAAEPIDRGWATHPYE